MERKVFISEAPQHLEADARADSADGLRLSGIRAWWANALLKLFAPREPASRSYRYLARQLQADLGRDGAAVRVAITAPGSAKESTEAVLMLAYGMQDELDAKVLIIDATFGNEGAGARVGLRGAPGFVDVVYSEKYGPAELIRPTNRRGISILPAGTPPAAGCPPLKAEKVQAVLAEAGERFDYVLIQEGSVLHDTRSVLVASKADLTLMLVEERVTLLEELENCQRVLTDHDVSNFRVVMYKEQ